MHHAGMLLATVSLALASRADAASPPPPTFVAAHYGSVQTLVAVQGARRLNLACIGSGKMTVIFLSGLGGGTFDWRKVQPAVGRSTRACAYDRAGYGFSDPASAPLDVANTIADLHALIHARVMTTPVLLVAHSVGELYATSYALHYPGDVAGMVLVDPAFTGQTSRIANVIGPAAARRLQAANGKTLASLDKCAALAATGRLSTPEEEASDCLDNPPDTDPDVHRERNREAKSLAFQRALRSEFEMANIVGTDGATTDDRQSGWSGSTLGAMPLTVLTRGKSEVLSGLSPAEIVKAELAWREGHDRLARLSSVGTNSVVPGARHFIQLDQPADVIGQILDIVSKVRR